MQLKHHNLNLWIYTILGFRGLILIMDFSLSLHSLHYTYSTKSKQFEIELTSLVV